MNELNRRHQPQPTNAALNDILAASLHIHRMWISCWTLRQFFGMNSRTTKEARRAELPDGVLRDGHGPLGARWKSETGQHILHLRALALSDRWEPAVELTLRPLAQAVRPAA
jgi:hypothetical protein